MGYARRLPADRNDSRDFCDFALAQTKCLPGRCAGNARRRRYFTRASRACACAGGAGYRGLMAFLLAVSANSLLPSADWAVLGACLALAVATLLFIFYIQPDASDLAPHRSKLDQLLERRDTIYDNLRDLRFEYRSAKYSEPPSKPIKSPIEPEPP